MQKGLCHDQFHLPKNDSLWTPHGYRNGWNSLIQRSVHSDIVRSTAGCPVPYANPHCSFLSESFKILTREPIGERRINACVRTVISSRMEASTLREVTVFPHSYCAAANSCASPAEFIVDGPDNVCSLSAHDLNSPQACLCDSARPFDFQRGGKLC